MRTRDLKIQILFQTLLSLAFIVGGVKYWTQQMPQISERKILEWHPENFASSSSKSIEVHDIALLQSNLRPVFSLSRKPFDPTKIVAEIPVAPPVLPPVLEMPKSAVSALAPELPKAELPPSAPPDTSQLLLKGIVMNGRRRLALIVSTEMPEGKWFALEEIVGGWKIKTISKNSVLIIFDQQEKQLTLYVDNPVLPVGSP
jgi:hypothetical protein